MGSTGYREVMLLNQSDRYAIRPLQIMGISFDGPAGTLPRGARYSIPVSFLAITPGNSITFTLRLGRQHQPH